MNVNISNELNFSDVYRIHKLHWAANKVTLHATQCSLYFDKHQKNEIHSLNNITFL